MPDSGKTCRPEVRGKHGSKKWRREEQYKSNSTIKWKCNPFIMHDLLTEWTYVPDWCDSARIRICLCTGFMT